VIVVFSIQTYHKVCNLRKTHQILKKKINKECELRNSYCNVAVVKSLNTFIFTIYNFLNKGNVFSHNTISSYLIFPHYYALKPKENSSFNELGAVIHFICYNRETSF
jgi:hypothetical protein